jgi:hypothetical protein
MGLKMASSQYLRAPFTNSAEQMIILSARHPKSLICESRSGLPADRQKELFFRNIMGVVMDRQPTFLGSVKTVLSLAMVMKEHDNYPVIWAGPRILGKTVQAGIRRWTTYLLRGAVAGIGRLYGLQGTYEEYTPDELLDQVCRSY